MVSSDLIDSSGNWSKQPKKMLAQFDWNIVKYLQNVAKCKMFYWTWLTVKIINSKICNKLLFLCCYVDYVN